MTKPNHLEDKLDSDTEILEKLSIDGRIFLRELAKNSGLWIYFPMLGIFNSISLRVFISIFVIVKVK